METTETETETSETVDGELCIHAVHLSRMADAHVDGVGPLTGVLTLKDWESFDALLEGVRTQYKQREQKTLVIPWHRIECLEVK